MGTQGTERVIVALDTNDIGEARMIIDYLAPHVSCFKVGLELLTAAGSNAVVDAVRRHGKRVMYDGKFNDIPNTMAGATRAVAALGVDLFTVHASCGTEGMCEVAKAKGSAKALAVTVLTSFDVASCENVFGAAPDAKVPLFVRDAKSAGMDGVVCSPRELALFSDPRYARYGEGLLKVTPGVRPAWAGVGDQKRVMTPHDAIMAGADCLVIGRPILHPPAAVGGPIDAMRLIVEEIDAALERRALLASLKAAEEPDCGGCR